jgi:hypothetical protein
MYYDDRFNPATENDNVSFESKKRRADDEFKKMDKKYFKNKVAFFKQWIDGKYYKNITIEGYGSGEQDTPIRNAVTGQRYQYLVGSEYEDLFFKVSDSTGRSGNRSSIQLFYDSPEQYENHQFTIVNQAIKEKWYQKNLAQRQILSS